MGYKLTGDQLKIAIRRLGEIQRQLGQEDYPHNPEQLNLALQAMTEGRFEAVGGQFSSAVLAADLIPKGWSVVEDVAPSQFDVGKLKPCSFLKDGDGGVIGGEEMRRRAAVEFKANWSLADGKRMIAEQDRIPVEFRDFYIPLPGTLLRDSVGSLRIAYLYFNGDRWYLNFGWLGRGWLGSVRLALSE